MISQTRANKILPNQSVLPTLLFLVLLSLARTEPAVSQEEEIEEIVVTTTRSRRSFEQQPTRVEVLGSEEMNEKANMKPGNIRMLLNESTGIHVQQTSPTSFNSSIRIQGLDGKYTQLLRDGMPLYGGFSGGLSLLQVAPLDLKQVEVVKGSNSTLYGGGAIAGIVNLISKKPDGESERSLLLNGTSAGGVDASGFFSGMSGDVGASLFTSYNTSQAYDPADNGLSAIPEFERWTFNPQLFLGGESSELRLGISAVVEDRLGGGIDFIQGRRDVPAYYEDSSTERVSTQLEYVTQLNSGNEFVLRNSVNHFERELDVPGFSFSGTQISSFSEAHIVGASGALDWVAGFNIWTENFDQDAVFSGSSLDFNSQTEGAFAQGTYLLTDRWIIDGGLRIDHTSDYGSFILPRASLLYKPASDTAIRIGGGLGYKEPTPFTEEAESIQYRGVLPLDISALDAEQSVGMNVDINKSLEIGTNLSLNLNLLLFYTRVNDPLRLIQIDTDHFAFRQPNDTLDSKGTEINAVFRWDDFKIFLGYTHADVEENTIGGVESAPLVPKDRLNSVFVYEREDDIRIGLEAYYYGRQELTSGARSRDYWIFGLMIEKIFSDKFSLFVNFENFTDTRQTRYGSINSGTLASPIFADIFAPLDGYVANGGIKLRF